MIAEAIAKLVELGQQAQEVKIVSIPGDDSRVIVQQGDTHSFEGVPPPLRRHVVFSLDSLVTAAQKWCSDDEADAGGVLWHDPKRVTLIVDDDSRRETVVLELPESPQFLTLRGLAKQSVLNHQGMVRLLRHDLHNCVQEHVLPAIRRVQFRRREESLNDRQRNRESLGRSIEAEVSGAAELADLDEILVTLPVYAVDGLRQLQTVKCSLDIDVQQEQFRLAPLPGELENAVDATQRWLDDHLADETGLSVLYGSPTR